MSEISQPIQDKLRHAIREKQRKEIEGRSFDFGGAIEILKIIGLCIAASVVYGVLHDQAAVRICAEYFTVGRIPLLKTISPTLLALGWGIIGTWWVGLILGLPLAFICRFGPRPKLTASDLLRPLLVLLLTMAVASVLFGVIGYHRAQAGHMWLRPPVDARVPADRHCAYLANLWAHAAASCVGFFGGVVLWFSAWGKRRTRVSAPPPELLLMDEVSRN